MTNRPRVKGTSWETESQDYLNSHDSTIIPEFSRTGSADFGAGDLRGGEWLIECKAEQTINLPGYLKQLKGEIERNYIFPLKAAVYVKNRRHSVGEGYAVMSIENHRDLIAYVEGLEYILDQVETSLKDGKGGPELREDTHTAIKAMQGDVTGNK